MNLFKSTLMSMRWIGSVVLVFLRTRLWTTLSLIVTLTIGRFIGMLVFLLPLKIILLAGSDGVPRYFTAFIDSTDKNQWIMWLSIATVGAYFMSMVLDAIGKRLSEAGSTEVLQGANEIAVASRQREEAQGYYAGFSQVVSDVLLVLISYSILGLINPVLIGVLLGLCFLEYILTAAVLGFGNEHYPGAVQQMVRSNTAGYLKGLFSINFLAAFFVLLVPFLAGNGGNIILAIVAILLMRRTSSALTGGIWSAVRLTKQRFQIDPMIFRDRLVQKTEKTTTKDLRQFFGKKQREARARQHLTAYGLDSEKLISEWQDPAGSGIYTFRLHLDDPKGESRYLQEQVFPSARLHLLEHETYLFEHLSRDHLFAPKVYCRFGDGPFESQVCDYGLARGCGVQLWAGVCRRLMTHFWSFDPPRALVNAYNTSHPTLEGRLTPEYLQRVEVALDRSEQVRLYEELLFRLPGIRKLLAAVPVYVLNPDMNRAGVIKFGEDEFRVMMWGRWAIEHIGATLFKPLDGPVIAEMLQNVRARRSLPEDALTPEHVKLVNDCREFEREVNRGSYAQAVNRIKRIVGNTLVRSRYELSA